MVRDDTLLLVTASDIPNNFEGFGGEVYEDNSEQPECVPVGGP
jgi:hypothetical protein